MQATQAEFGTQPGQDYIKSLFSDIPADARDQDYIAFNYNCQCDKV